MQTGRSHALARGQVFELEGKTFFAMGGGRLTFDRWFFGHYHCDQEVDGKYFCLFNQLYELKTGKRLREPQQDNSTKGSYTALAEMLQTKAEAN